MSVDEDIILRGVDAKTYLSLNGPRTTNMITKLIPASAQASFLAVLRVVRVWAKNRGLYANKMGYLGTSFFHPPTHPEQHSSPFQPPRSPPPNPPIHPPTHHKTGGVNFNILVAMICQMYPRANPALMLHRFFLVLGER